MSRSVKQGYEKAKNPGNTRIQWCPICNIRPADTATRKDTFGKHWCQPCENEFDSIDWDAEADRRLGQ